MRLLTAILSLIVAISVATTAFAHESRDIAGMHVVFGGEPEPVLDGEICFLRWRFSDLKTEEPVTTLEALSAKIQFDGKEVGPFEPRGSGRNPGRYQTQHIFTKPGDGEVTLSFKKAASDEVLTLTFPFTVRSRKAIEIP